MGVWGATICWRKPPGARGVRGVQASVVLHPSEAFCRIVFCGPSLRRNLSVRSTMLVPNYVKARNETPVIYHGSRMTQRESWLVGKVVQPLQSVKLL